jgi:beta-lactamase regulating signal transducer with metallopeptidase domain
MAHSILAFLSDTAAAASVTLLLDAAVKGAAVLLGVGLIALTMRRASAAARHLVWTTGLVGLLMLPLISAVTPKWEVLPDWLRPESLTTEVADDRETERSAGRASPSQSLPSPVDSALALNAAASLHSDVATTGSTDAETGMTMGNGPLAVDSNASGARSWLNWAVGLCVFGTAGLLLRMGLSRIILGRVAHAASPVEEGPIRDLLVAICRRYAIRRDVRVYVTEERDLPMTWGFFRHRILLPADAAEWPPGRLEAVLLHELAHVKRCDTITHVIGQVACALYWFNPLVWLAAWRIHVERERACDDLVVASGVKASDYAEHLLRIIGLCRRRRTVPCTAVAMAKASRLEGRLLAILNERVNRAAATRGFFTAVFVTGLVGLIVVSMLRAQDRRDVADSARFGETVELIVSDDSGATPSGIARRGSRPRVDGGERL